MYCDDQLVIVDKPAGLLVHPSQYDHRLPNCREATAGMVNGRLWTVHRIDRATSGLVIFARSETAAGALSRSFRMRLVAKRYLAVLRGHLMTPCDVDAPLRRERRASVSDAHYDEAHSRFVPLAHGVVDRPVGKFDQGWYTLAALELNTGRRHQARRHAAFISHPVIGDREHGDGVQNRFYTAHCAEDRMLFRAHEVRFPHPGGWGSLQIRVGVPDWWVAATVALGFDPSKLPSPVDMVNPVVGA